ncbi:MAG: hypothetical protein HZR80_05070 [Candidatus Heimdallarchaeota archaeon]
MKGKRKGTFLKLLPFLTLIAVLILFVVFIVLELSYKPIISSFFLKFFWLGLFVSLIAEAIFLGALAKTVLPWIRWRWQKFIFNRFVVVNITAHTKYNINNEFPIDEFMKLIKEISKKSYDKIQHEQEETPSDYWIQITLGNQIHGVSFRACCLDNDPTNYSKIEIKITNEIPFRTFYDSIINIQSIMTKFHLSLQQTYSIMMEMDNVIFEVSPLGYILIENYWFKQVSKDQVIKVETKDGFEILLYEDKAQLCVKEFTSSIREYLENLIISSYEKTQP